METLFYAAWAATLSILTIVGVQEEEDKSRAKFWLPLDTLSGLIAVLALLSFKIDWLPQFLGKALVPIAVLAAIEIAVSAYLEMSAIEPDEELTEAENKFAIGGGAVLIIFFFGGALVLGIVRGWAAWI